MEINEDNNRNVNNIIIINLTSYSFDLNESIIDKQKLDKNNGKKKTQIAIKTP